MALPQAPELPDGVVPPDARQPRWPWWLPILALLGTFAIATFALLIGVAVTGKTKPTSGVTIAATYVQDAGLVVCAILFAFMTRRPSAWQFGLRPTRLLPAVGWLAVAWLAFFTFSAIWSVFMNAVGVKLNDDLPEQLGVGNSNVALVFVAVLVCVIAPMAEEFFFRGYFYGALRNWNVLGATLITGLVFGSIHAGSAQWEFLLPLAFFGAALCWLRERTGSLYPGIVLHCANNSIAFGVSQHWGWEIGVLFLGSVAVFWVVAILVRARWDAAAAVPAA
jgi:membrane protease YdiL (CAAX protease family)